MALTAASNYRESLGSLTLNIVNFASVTTAGDFWASKMNSIVTVWANCTTSATQQTTSGCSAGVLTSSAGTVWVQPSKDSAVTLFVLSRS